MDILWVIVVGLVAGFLGGLLGVGGGILMVPAFLYLLRDRIPSIHVAVGTSMAVIVAVSIAGTIGHARGGRVNWSIVPYVAVFAVVGSYVGASLTSHVSRMVLRRLFAILLLVVAAKMIFSKPDQTAAATAAPPAPATAAGPTAEPARRPAAESPPSPGDRSD